MLFKLFLSIISLNIWQRGSFFFCLSCLALSFFVCSSFYYLVGIPSVCTTNLDWLFTITFTCQIFVPSFFLSFLPSFFLSFFLLSQFSFLFMDRTSIHTINNNVYYKQDCIWQTFFLVAKSIKTVNPQNVQFSTLNGYLHFELKS